MIAVNAALAVVMMLFLPIILLLRRVAGRQLHNLAVIIAMVNHILLLPLIVYKRALVDTPDE